MLLDELLEVQEAVKHELISTTEVRFIREQWKLDETDAVFRELCKINSVNEALNC